MIEMKREKELERLFEEYKSDLKLVERLIKHHDLPSNFGPVLKEQIEQRVIGKALSGIMYREDMKDGYQQRAEGIKHFYDSLIKQGFDHETSMTIICGLEEDNPLMKKTIEESDEEGE